MAKTPLQKQRRINDKAIKAAAGVRTNRKSVNVTILCVAVVACTALFITLNTIWFHIDGFPVWSELIGWSDPITKSPSADEVQVHFIDVGQGDSAIIRTDRYNILIDAGERDMAGKVFSYLRANSVDKLDFVICTHPHSDHIGGISSVIDEIETGTVILPQIPDEIIPATDSYTDLLRTIEQKSLDVRYPAQNETLKLDDNTYITFLASVENYEELNNYSIVCKLVHGENSFLFTGDIQSEAEEAIIRSGADVSADVLKVPHHGSTTSSSYYFLKNVRPEYAVFDVGAFNDYGHPHNAVLRRYEEFGCKIYRTDRYGSVVFISNGKNIDVVTEKTYADS